MDIVKYATPFFLVAIVVELAWGLLRKNNTYRLNDSVNSLSLGMFSTLAKLIFLSVGGQVFSFVENNWALFSFNPSSAMHWFVALIIYDFCYYWFHRISHERQLFWGSHVAHHQSEDYNLSTALRQTSTGLFTTWVFYIPCFIVGIPIEMFVTIASGHLVYQFWIHTQHIPKLGFLEWFLISPSNHRVHHAQNPRYIDKNYGGLLIVWDRLFGTFAEEDENEEAIYGIRSSLRSWNPVWANLHIYVNMVRDAWHAEKIKDKFHVLWARTGWRPEDVQQKYPQQKSDLQNFQKYDPVVSRTVWLTVAVHYALMLVYFLWFMAAAPEMAYPAQLANALVCVLSAMVIGALSDRNNIVLPLEIMRLTLLTGIAIFAYTQSAAGIDLIFAAIAYAVVSLILTGVAIKSSGDPIDNAAVVSG